MTRIQSLFAAVLLALPVFPASGQGAKTVAPDGTGITVETQDKFLRKLGGSAAGRNLFKKAAPEEASFPRINPDGTWDWRSPNQYRTDLGLYGVAAVSTADFDWSATTYFTKTLTGNTTITFSNVIPGKTVFLAITGAGPWGINWPAGITWMNGGTPSAPGNGVLVTYRFIATSPTTFSGAVEASTAAPLAVARGGTGNATGQAQTVVTNANLTGPVTSVGNATAIADGALSLAKTAQLPELLDGKVSSSIFTPPPRNSPTLLVHDDFSGQPATLSLGQTRTAFPGPGVAEVQQATSSAGSRLMYENNEALLYSVPMTGAAATTATWTPLVDTGITAAPGLAMEARLVPSVKLGIPRNSFVGFSLNWATNQPRAGMINFQSGVSAGSSIGLPARATSSDDTFRSYEPVVIGEDEEVATLVHYKSLNDIRYYVQGRAFANVGCGVGMNWFPIGRNVPTKQIWNRGFSGTCTSNGNLTVTVTITGMAGSPKAYSVPLTTATHNTQLKVADAIAAVLNADSAFNANWTATGHQMHSTGAVSIEATTARDHDSGMDVVITPGLGITQAIASGAALSTGTQSAGRMGEVSAIAAAPTVWPAVSHQYLSSTRIRNIKVWSGFQPNGESEQFGYTRGGNGVHVPSVCKDPVTGLTVVSFNFTTSHIGTDATMMAVVRKADGSWTDEQVLMGPSKPVARQNCALFQWQNKLWWSYFDMWESGDTTKEGGTLYRREVTINPTTGAITLGSIINCNVPSSFGLFFSPPTILPSGRVVWSWHQDNGGGAIRGYSAYSDNGMATWSTPVQHHASWWLAEPSQIIEDDGAIGIWWRANTSTAGCAVYSRSTDNGATWSAPVKIPAIPMPATSGSRLHAYRMTDGSMWLIGNNESAINTRSNLTIWRIGNNGQVLDTGTEIYDPVPEYAPSNFGSYAQYPDIFEVAPGKLGIAYSRQASGGLTVNTAINYHEIPWSKTVIGQSVGGTSTRRIDYRPDKRKGVNVSRLDFSSTPTPDMRKGPVQYILMTGNITSLNVPANGQPYEELELMFIQGGSGSYTTTFHADWDMGAYSNPPTSRTAVNSFMTLKARYNAIAGKWGVTSWN